MMPAPMMTTRLLISADAPTERVFVVEQLRCLGVHERRAGDDRRNFAGSLVQPVELARERAADDAFLDPRLAGQKLSVRRQASELRAGARPARRTVVGLARTLHEI